VPYACLGHNIDSRHGPSPTRSLSPGDEGQIVHDSIHRGDGWTVTYILNVDGVTAGFGSIALAGALEG
jgi:hypothetical protein